LPHGGQSNSPHYGRKESEIAGIQIHPGMQEEAPQGKAIPQESKQPAEKPDAESE